jgi:flagellar protein FlaE
LPEGFASDLIVVEWLEFLVSEAGVRETAQAIDYYETIDWIDESVADDLQTYLRGFDGGGTGTLTIDHHTKSLKYISQLNGGTGAVVTDRMDRGGGLDGLQR